MGRAPTGHRKYTIEYIWEIHHEIIRRLVLGQKPKDIARDLGITPQTVSNVRNSPIAQKKLQVLSTVRDGEVMDITKRLAELAPRAVDVLEEVMEDPGARPNDRINAAKDILNRAQVGTERTINVRHGQLPPETIGRIRSKGIELMNTLLGPYVTDVNDSQVEYIEKEETTDANKQSA